MDDYLCLDCLSKPNQNGSSDQLHFCFMEPAQHFPKGDPLDKPPSGETPSSSPEL